MEEKKYKRKSILIVCNILLTLLLLLTTAVTITLAVQQFNMNIGGNITFNATDVQATISAGQISNGTVADSTSKMQQIVLTPGTDGATEKATWKNLEITFDGLDDVIISFTVTNNHTESNLKMSLTTSSIDANNMTISTKIDNSSKTSVIIPKQAEGNDNKVDCQIIFHVESNLTSANIEGFSIEYTFENTDEEPTYAVSIDPSSSDMVTGVSLNNATAGQQVIVTANISDTVTEDYVIMSDGLYYVENGSDEKVRINQTDGQYSFTMPANDITIGIETYRRLDDFTFDGNSITDYTGSDSELTLPAYYETVNINSQDYIVEKDSGTQITEIGNNAFLNCSSLTSVTIPEGVTSIGDSAFSYCYNLTSITIPETVTSIGDNTFSGTRLSSITIPASVTSIGSSAFYGCYSLALVINNSSNITITKGDSGNGRVGSYAYEVVNPGGSVQGRVEEINNVQYYINDRTQEKVALFAIDRSVSSISLEEDTTSINQYAFSGCTNLTTVNFGDNSQLQSIGSSAFSGCTSLSSITIPSQVAIIGGAAFYDCTSLSSITIPEGVTSIDYAAFGQCTNLTTVNFGDNSQLQSIGPDAFSRCTNLTSITIPANVTSISSSAFDGCTKLTSVTIESDDIYKIATSSSSAGNLLANAMTVKVLKTIVDTCENSYLENSSNFTTSKEGEYTVFTKKV